MIKFKTNSRYIPFYVGILVLSIFSLVLVGCSTTQTVMEKTTKTVKRTTRNITRTIVLSDEDLKRKVGIFNFENNGLQESEHFEGIFNKGLPEYLSDRCPGILIVNSDTGELLNPLSQPPKLSTGFVDGYALTLIGRQLGLNAIVTGSLEDIRIIDELQGLWWAKDTHHMLMVFIRVEVFDTRTATKILDNTFDRQIEIEDLEYRNFQNSERIDASALNETLNQLLTDIGDSICDAVRDQPWTGFITKIEDDRFVIPSGIEVGFETGEILEVFDSSRIIEGLGGDRFFIPGLKIGEIEIVTIHENMMVAQLISGEDIQKGSTVRRK